MYSVKGRNLRDAHQFHGGQKIAKPIVTNRGFLRFLFLFTLLYIVIKSIHCSTSFSRKKDSEFDRKKEMYTMREEKE